MKSGTVGLEEVRLHYLTAGDGPLLVMLHGFPAFSASWEPLIPELARRFRVVAPDMRGYNLSDKPRGVRSYRLETLCRDVAQLVEALGERQADLVGHDWGGAVTWATAALHPDKVRRAAVLNCPHPTAMARHLWTNARQRRRSWYIFFFQIPWLPEAILRRYADRFLERAFRGTHVDLARYRRALLEPGALTASINYYRAAFRASLSPGRLRLPAIQAPSLLVWGEKDLALGRELTLGMERYFAGPYQARYLPDCGHWVHDEAPERVLGLLREHFSA